MTKPINIDYAHIATIVASRVQSTLVPPIQSGRGESYLVAKFVTQCLVDSVPWLTYALEIHGSYPGKVPKTALALIYEDGSRVLHNLNNNTEAIRKNLKWAAPRIYGHGHWTQATEKYQIVVMEDVESTGKPLDAVWGQFDDDQKKAALEMIADILCCAIHVRPPPDYQGPLQPRLDKSAASSSSAAVKEQPTRVPISNLGHLKKAYTLVYLGLFLSDGEPDEKTFQSRFREYNTYTPSDQDKIRIKNLNKIIAENMSDFAGGSFLPPHISGMDKIPFKNAKERHKFQERSIVLHTILSEPIFRLQHKYMHMSAFIVQFDEGNNIKSIVLTQWDKAYYSPLWSSCHLPPWLHNINPELQVPSLEEEEAIKWREYLIYHLMLKKERLPRSWIWFVAHVYGELERHFETIITITWPWNAKTEPWMKQVMEHAKKKRTDAYKKDSEPFVPLAGIHTMNVNFSELMGKWMPFARKFVTDEGYLSSTD